MRIVDSSIPVPASRIYPHGVVEGFAKCRSTEDGVLVGWYWSPADPIQDWRLVPGESLIFPPNSPIVHL